MKETIFFLALFMSFVSYVEMQAKTHDKKGLTDNGLQYFALLFVVAALWTVLYILS